VVALVGAGVGARIAADGQEKFMDGMQAKVAKLKFWGPPPASQPAPDGRARKTAPSRDKGRG
jgi:hypothetical protein